MRELFFKIGVVLVLFIIVGCQGARKEQMTRDRTVLSASYDFACETGTIPYDSIHIKKINKKQDSISFYKEKKQIRSIIINYD
ncbi:MAG TPA: hypothetical protein VK021_03150 [Flavobacteriaceae bacterium]|nr:hypothetical protein [Flavobacteriaceae bacterium]